jgi:hypothetical protein
MKQSLEVEARLLRFARNDTKIRESDVNTHEVRFSNLNSRIKFKSPQSLDKVGGG